MKKLFDLLILKFILRSKINIWLGKIIFKNSGGLVSNSIGAYIKRSVNQQLKEANYREIYGLQRLFIS